MSNKTVTIKYNTTGSNQYANFNQFTLWGAQYYKDDDLESPQNITLILSIFALTIVTANILYETLWPIITKNKVKQAFMREYLKYYYPHEYYEKYHNSDQQQQNQQVAYNSKNSINNNKMQTSHLKNDSTIAMERVETQMPIYNSSLEDVSHTPQKNRTRRKSRKYSQFKNQQQQSNPTNITDYTSNDPLTTYTNQALNHPAHINNQNPKQNFTSDWISKQQQMGPYNQETTMKQNNNNHLIQAQGKKSFGDQLKVVFFNQNEGNKKVLQNNQQFEEVTNYHVQDDQNAKMPNYQQHQQQFNFLSDLNQGKNDQNNHVKNKISSDYMPQNANEYKPAYPYSGIKLIELQGQYNIRNQESTKPINEIKAVEDYKQFNFNSLQVNNNPQPYSQNLSPFRNNANQQKSIYDRNNVGATYADTFKGLGNSFSQMNDQGQGYQNQDYFNMNIKRKRNQ